MRVSTQISLVALLITGAQTQDQRWIERHVKREVAVQERIAESQSPIGLRKMSDDEGEKFWVQYWDFGEYANTSLHNALAAIAPHTRHTNGDLRLFGRSIFARDYKCPENTNSCSTIDSPLCCPSDQTCVRVSGGVGCCPQGENCGQGVAGCDIAAGFTSCPNSNTGGCCIPGAVCDAEGCVFYGTSTTIVQGPTATVTAQGASSSTEATSPGPSTTTVTVTQTINGSPTTIVSATTILVGAAGGGSSSSSPSSVSPSPSSSPSTATAAAPIRPTSMTDSSISAAARSSATSAMGACPTGYYMCEAYFLGGCCRVGRDCETTSCPATESTAVVSSGVTVVVPAGTTSGSGGSCANGWSSCAASAGGGCCPSGYTCGQSCTAPPGSGSGNTAKMAPSAASSLGITWGLIILGLLSGIGMILL